MKTKVLLAVCILTSAFCYLTSYISSAQSGGPDQFGYTWKNNTAPGGPVYNWKNINGTGTKINGLGDDNSIANIQLLWSFHYYWSDYSKITVGSNGWVGFTGNPGNIAAPFPAFPATAAKSTISPLLADLTFTQTNSSPVPGTSAWYWTNNVDSFIVQYDSVPYWVNNPSGYAGRYTFQVILSGVDSSITFQYQTAQAGTPAYTATEGSATGIVNSTGQIGLQVLPSLTFPTAMTAVKFYYPNPVTYQVFDATPAWNQNADNGGFFVLQNSTVNNLTTDIANAGNQTISNINVKGELFDNSFTQVWTNTTSVSSLAAGADSMLTYPAAYAANTAGTFVFRSTTSGSTPADINPANDITDVEMVVVTPQPNMALSYVSPATPATQNSWGGNGGQGIYIEPPFYPATITSLDFMVTSSDVVGYHLVQIVDDNGPGNSPGTVLYLDSVAASTPVTPLVYTNVPVTTPIVITSGGVYVAWLENGDSLSAIGTDAALPLSNRNYEIIGGSWANYRNNSVDDIMIQVNIDGSCAMSFSMTTTYASCSTCSDGTASVNITGGTAPYTYTWSPSGGNSATATALMPGTYTICVTDNNGCSACKAVTITANTGVAEIISGASIVISPNPFITSANVKIDFVNPTHQGLNFEVYDIYGRVIQSTNLGSLTGTTVDFTLNRNNIPAGLYFYKLKDNSEILSAGKVVIQ